MNSNTGCYNCYHVTVLGLLVLMLNYTNSMRVLLLAELVRNKNKTDPRSAFCGLDMTYIIIITVLSLELFFCAIDLSYFSKKYVILSQLT
jgi:hypothetical protein